MEKIFWTEALDQMRKISNEESFFSFSFATYNRENVEGGEIVEVPKAQLRKSLPEGFSSEVSSDLLLPYLNEDGEPRMCYKHLLLSFNETPVTFDRYE